jgi:hypothetical protein
LGKLEGIAALTDISQVSTPASNRPDLLREAFRVVANLIFRNEDMERAKEPSHQARLWNYALGKFMQPVWTAIQEGTRNRGSLGDPAVGGGDPKSVAGSPFAMFLLAGVVVAVLVSLFKR